MEQFISFISSAINQLLHLDQTLVLLTQDFGPWIYLILFLVIFAETGLVFTPFLPGDSLLFAVGALCALDGSTLQLSLIWPLLISAAVIGDNTNYWIGHLFGEKLLSSGRIPINRKYLMEAEKFYSNYGARTIVLARFLPILRTFAPFAAGVSKMNYKVYVIMSAMGSFFWMSVFIPAGYYFGNIPIVKKNFHIVIMAVILISFLPIFYKLLKSRLAAR